MINNKYDIENEKNDAVDSALEISDKFWMSAVQLEKNEVSKLMDRNKELMNRNLLTTQKYQRTISDLKWNHLLAIAKLEKDNKKELESLLKEKDKKHLHQRKKEIDLENKLKKSEGMNDKLNAKIIDLQLTITTLKKK